MNHHVALFHRVNCYPIPPDDFTFEQLLEEVIASGAKGTIFSQWSKAWPYYSEGSQSEIALRARINAALSRCDQAGLRVWFETQQLSKFSYGNPCYLPTKIPDPTALVVQNLLTDNLESDKPFFFDLTPSTEPNYRLFYDVVCEPWRYYEFSVYVSCKGHNGKVGGLGFYRFDEDTQQYYNVSGTELKAGYNRIRFHSLDCAKWQFVCFADAYPLRIIPAQLAERLPEAGENIGTEAEPSFWNCTKPMYRCRPAEAGSFSCDCPNPANRHALWRGYSLAYQQWEWLLAQNHPCLEGWFGTGDEPSILGYQREVLERFGSAGAAYVDNASNFAEFAYAITGKPALLYSDCFDPHHNGQQFKRANNPAGGGFATAPAALSKDCPAIFLCWNEDNMNSLQKSITYWSESGHRWWLALFVEYNNAEAAAAMIAALPADKRPEAVLWFTWDTRLIRAATLQPKFALFN